jgi:nucleoid DNA-binding protein
MNKADLTQTLSTTNGLSKVEAAKIVNLFFEKMAGALEAHGNRSWRKSLIYAPDLYML